MVDFRLEGVGLGSWRVLDMFLMDMVTADPDVRVLQAKPTKKYGLRVDLGLVVWVTGCGVILENYLVCTRSTFGLRMFFVITSNILTVSVRQV